MPFLGATTAAISIVACFVLYNAAIIIQRLFFSPLSRFPGPKLAAATYLSEIYYDIFKGEGGQLPFKIREWHEQYGPIIRINPDELHIKDSTWYETLYAPSRPVRKQPNWGHRFKSLDSAVGTNDPALYRIRRGALNPFFAKRKVAESGGMVQGIVNRIMSRLETEYQGTGRILSLSHVWECLTTDVVNLTTFGYNNDSVEGSNFSSPANRATEALLETSKWFLHFPIIPTLVDLLPERLVVALVPMVEPIVEDRKKLEDAIGEAKIAHASGKNDEKTLFGSLLQQDLLPQELSVARLTQEATTITGAGGETTSRTLAIACFHILDQPAIRSRLVEELNAAIPDAANMPGWNELAALPYLTACIEEAVRLTYGLSERRARAYDGGDLMYKDWTIPAGTFVGMNHYDVAHDEAIFPNSFAYIPERWLGDPRAPDGKALSRYLVSFGKGMRGCIGIQVAYLQLYVGIATFFRSPLVSKLRLYQTDKKDVQMARDCFVARPSKKSKGVQVIFDNEK